jgi:hypothetical protein
MGQLDYVWYVAGLGLVPESGSYLVETGEGIVMRWAEYIPRDEAMVRRVYG